MKKYKVVIEQILVVECDDEFTESDIKKVLKREDKPFLSYGICGEFEGVGDNLFFDVASQDTMKIISIKKK